MKKILLFLLFPTLAWSQKSANLPTWEGDIVLPYNLGDVGETVNAPFLNYGCDFLKYTMDEKNLGKLYFGIFRNRFFELIANKKLNCFYDAQLTKPLKKALVDNYSFKNTYNGCLSGLGEDQIARMVAEDYIARITIPLQYCYPINTFLIKQHFRYFASTQSIESEIIAIAPAAVTVFKPIYDYDDFKPIFWVENPVFTNNLDRNDPNNTFVMRTVHTYIADTLRVAEIETGKRTQQIRSFIIENIKNKPKQTILKHFFTEDNRESQYTLSQKGLDSILIAPPDTVVSYNPVTYEEVIEIKPPLPIQNDPLINAVALTQILLFDTKTGALAIENSNITTLRTIKDEKSNFRYGQRLFLYPIVSRLKKLKSKK